MVLSAIHPKKIGCWYIQFGGNDNQGGINFCQDLIARKSAVSIKADINT